ncbi:MAG: glycine cleavage system protein H [Candidatus Calescibacterium sp.]|jgi:glycine cleavage system H protein
MKIPKNLLFSEDHVWVLPKQRNIARIGITEFILQESDEIEKINIYVEEDTEIEAGDIIGEIETSDGTVEIVSPISGRVLKLNQDVIDNPETIIEDPYKEGWLMEIETSDSLESFSLLPYKEYKKTIEEKEEEDEEEI